MRVLLLASLFALTSCASTPFEGWKKENTVMEIAYLGLHVLDWGQTLDIADNPDRFHEMNPVIGRHPSRGRVNRYFAATAVLHPIVSGMLSEPYRDLFQYFSVMFSAGLVAHNYHIGLRYGW